MICESVKSDQKEKERDLLNGNRIINLNNLITKLDTFLVRKEFSQERGLQIKLEEERDVENFIDYVNLIGSGPGVFCHWGAETRFHFIRTVDRFSVIFYRPLILLGCCLSAGP